MARVGIRVLFSQVAPDQRHFSLGLGECQTRLQARDYANSGMHFAIPHPWRRVLAKGSEDVHVPEQSKPCGRDTNDSVGSAVKNEACADCSRIATKSRLPETVADNGYVRSARTVL